MPPLKIVRIRAFRTETVAAYKLHQYCIKTSNKMKNDFQYINALKGLVIFMMDNHEMCANIAEVPAIIKPEELKKYFTLYSGGNKAIKQFGSSFPVIDSNTFFRYETGEITNDSRMLLINCDNMIFALCAEKVLEIITLNRKNGENCLEYTPVEDDSYIKGIVRFEDNAWLLPDYIRISSELQARLAASPEYSCVYTGRLKF